MIPKSIGGSDELNNLALACRRCNERRYNFVAGYDLETKAIVPLFNPRQQIWSEHFIWSANGRIIVGVTPLVEQPASALILTTNVIQKMIQFGVRWVFGFKLVYILRMKIPN
ncbi:HNH endonuclease signature motif containing protein [Fischerella sp. JS2]|uniref:HNH endonuclease n=1 Tax=Fischerella sp. JS2 TaxID=2597771 RepID=UPI0028E7DB0E|nr:HNH endonuclease signature motif containing protein [Fischerella sp. JS2]